MSRNHNLFFSRNAALIGFDEVEADATIFNLKLKFLKERNREYNSIRFLFI